MRKIFSAKIGQAAANGDLKGSLPVISALRVISTELCCYLYQLSELLTVIIGQEAAAVKGPEQYGKAGGRIASVEVLGKAGNAAGKGKVITGFCVIVTGLYGPGKLLAGIALGLLIADPYGCEGLGGLCGSCCGGIGERHSADTVGAQHAVGGDYLIDDSDLVACAHIAGVLGIVGKVLIAESAVLVAHKLIGCYRLGIELYLGLYVLGNGEEGPRKLG